MDAKLLLVKVITLLFRESQIPDKTENSSELVKQILSSIKLPEAILDTDKGREILISLRSTAVWMANNPIQHEYERTELLQRIRVNIGDEINLFEAVLEGFEDITDPDKIKRICLQTSEQLKTYIKQNLVRDIIRKASQKVLFNAEEIDWSTYVGDVISELEPYSSIKEETSEIDADSIDFTNVQNLKDMLLTAKEETCSDGGLKTDIQGLNRMLGDHGSFLRGETWVIGALQHQFKSGFMMTLLRGFVSCNVPRLINPKKKPLIVFVTLENSLSTNILWLYGNFKEQESGEFCDTSDISVDEASEYLKTKFSENGYHVIMRKFNASEFTYRDLQNYLLKLESDGYEIHALLLDYLNTMSKAGCVKDTVGSDIRDLWRRMRNFCNPRKILFISPHQLSSEAKNLVRLAIDDFVKQIANKGYYDGCKGIDQEADGEICIHIEKHKGKSYLTCQRGKHRKAGRITPEEDLFTIIPFHPAGALRADINGEDLSMKKITSGAEDW